MKLAASLAVMALLVAVVDFSALLGVLPAADPIYGLLVIGVITVDRLLMSVKWSLLLRAVNVRIPMGEVIRTYYIGNFAGTFLPATVGLDATRGWYLSRRGHDLTTVASSIVVERTLGFVVLSLFSVVGMLMLLGRAGIDLSRGLWLNLAVLVILGTVLGVLISGPGRRFLERGARRLRGRRSGSMARKAYACYQLFRCARGSLAAFTLLTCLETALPGVEVYFAARALSIDVSLMDFAPLVPVYFFLARLPVAPNIIGVQEGLFVGLFSLVVMLPAQALALALLRRALNLVAVSPGLILYLLDQRQGSETVGRAA